MGTVNMNELKKDLAKAYAVLNPKWRIVGTAFIKTKEEYDAVSAQTLSKPICYCQMVRAAANGHRIKACDDSFKCRSGARVFGINPEDLDNSQGENWCRLGLYKDQQISKEVRAGLSYSKESQYGILIGPVEDFPELGIKPDVLIIIGTPYLAMRVVQGYSYQYGMAKNIAMIGNQAFCLECTARPYVAQDMNVSLLCIGTRHRTHWSDSEMAVGIPYGQFHDVAEGILQTVNIMEDNERKMRIQRDLAQAQIQYDIQFDYNYYKGIKTLRY